MLQNNYPRLHKFLLDPRVQNINIIIICILAVVLLILFIVSTRSGSFNKISNECKKVNYSKDNIDHITFNSRGGNGFLEVPGYGQLNNYEFISIGSLSNRQKGINNFNSIRDTINRETDKHNIYSLSVTIIYSILMVIFPVIFLYNYFNNGQFKASNLPIISIPWITILILLILINIQTNNINYQTDNLNNINITNKLIPNT